MESGKGGPRFGSTPVTFLLLQAKERAHLCLRINPSPPMMLSQQLAGAFESPVGEKEERKEREV